MTSKWFDHEQLKEFLVSEFSVDQTLADREAREIWYSQFEEVEKIEGSIEAVGRILSSGIQVGLISNIWHPYLQGAVKALGSMYNDISGPSFFLTTVKWQNQSLKFSRQLQGKRMYLLRTVL